LSGVCGSPVIFGGTEAKLAGGRDRAGPVDRAAFLGWGDVRPVAGAAVSQVGGSTNGPWGSTAVYCRWGERGGDRPWSDFGCLGDKSSQAF